MLYREGNIVFVNNCWLTIDSVGEKFKEIPFTTDSCFQYIEPRTTHTPDGDKIETWTFEVDPEDLK